MLFSVRSKYREWHLPTFAGQALLGETPDGRVAQVTCGGNGERGRFKIMRLRIQASIYTKHLRYIK